MDKTYTLDPSQTVLPSTVVYASGQVYIKSDKGVEVGWRGLLCPFVRVCENISAVLLLTTLRSADLPTDKNSHRNMCDIMKLIKHDKSL